MQSLATASDPYAASSQTVATPSLGVGSILNGRYRVVRKLASGGMGELYVVEHLLLGCRFALKTLHARLHGNDTAALRFRQEAEVGAELCHPSLVRVFDFETAGPLPYLVMELLEGEDMRSLLGRTPRMPVAVVARLLSDALEGLAVAHARGIVHRDLKPSNLFVTGVASAERCKLLDFGVAKVPGRSLATDEPLTLTDRPIGTLAYMAPEQIRGARDVDARADVYSACAVAFEMLTGKQPFEADSVPTQMFRALHDPTPRVGDLRDDCPDELADIIENGLSRDRDRRPPDADALARALAAFSREAASDEAPRLNPRSRKRRGVALTLAAGLGAAFGCAVGVASSTRTVASAGTLAQLRSTDPAERERPQTKPAPTGEPVAFAAPITSPTRPPAALATPLSSSPVPRQGRMLANRLTPPSAAVQASSQSDPISVERTNPYR